MGKRSAGLLMYRRGRSGGSLEVFLVHPGGPFWAKRDAGAWSIPKGEYSEEEDPLECARREFQEETGVDVVSDALIPLAPIKQLGGKAVCAWAFEGDCDAASIKSNLFSIEWPPKSGRQREFPEVDRAAWFDVNTAKQKIIKGQVSFIEELEASFRLE
jgi:predicted NUDIX family NTP pyrophosphohydrolase